MKNLLLFFVLIFVACTKDKIPLENKTFCIKVGYFDNSYFYKEFSPSMDLDIVWDSISLYGLGKDSIDLNQDSKYDLIFNLFIYNLDSVDYLNSLPSYYSSYFSIKTKADFSILSNSFITYLGQGNSVSTNYVDTLKFDQTICSNLNWIESANATNFWYESQSTNPFHSSGSWYEIDSISYFAIKYESKLGWVKIDHSNRFHPKIISYAFQK